MGTNGNSGSLSTSKSHAKRVRIGEASAEGAYIAKGGGTPFATYTELRQLLAPEIGDRFVVVSPRAGVEIVTRAQAEESGFKYKRASLTDIVLACDFGDKRVNEGSRRTKIAKLLDGCVPNNLYKSDRKKFQEFLRVLQINPDLESQALALFDKQTLLFQANPESYTQMLAEAKGVAVTPRGTQPAVIA